MSELLALGHLNNRMESWAASGAERGIVYRYPLLDKRVIEFAYSLPAYSFHHLGFPRFLYRKAADRILPESFVWTFPKRENSRFQRWQHPKDPGPVAYA